MLANTGMLGIGKVMRLIQKTDHLCKDSYFANKLCNNLGEDAPPADPPKWDGKFSEEQQAAVDKIINSRYAQWKSGSAGTEEEMKELREFKTQHEKDAEAKTQKDLESAQKYEEAQKGNLDKITALEGIISGQKVTIQDMRVSQTVGGEVTKQNGFQEESMALLRNQLQVNEDGTIQIKGKDSNNQESLLSIEAGVKQFLENRPHLVKASSSGGAGTTSTPDGSAGSTGLSTDLTQLNIDYQQRLNIGDREGAAKVKAQIATVLASKGVNSVGV